MTVEPRLRKPPEWKTMFLDPKLCPIEIVEDGDKCVYILPKIWKTKNGKWNQVKYRVSVQYSNDVNKLYKGKGFVVLNNVGLSSEASGYLVLGSVIFNF